MSGLPLDSLAFALLASCPHRCRGVRRAEPGRRPARTGRPGGASGGAGSRLWQPAPLRAVVISSSAGCSPGRWMRPRCAPCCWLRCIGWIPGQMQRIPSSIRPLRRPGRWPRGASAGWSMASCATICANSRNCLPTLAADPVAASQHPDWWLHRLQAAYPALWPGDRRRRQSAAADGAACQSPALLARENIRRA